MLIIHSVTARLQMLLQLDAVLEVLHEEAMAVASAEASLVTIAQRLATSAVVQITLLAIAKLKP